MTAIRRIVILGGGVAGCMCALGLSRAVAGTGVSIDLVETGRPDHSIGPFGPTEATLPAFHAFLAANDVDEDALMRAAGGSFALGTAFSGWAGEESSWFLPFGDIGAPIGSVPFPQLVAKLRGGGQAIRLADFSLAAVAAASGRFARPSADPRSVLSSYGYGLHLDKAAFAAAMRGLARGVTCHKPPFVRAIRGDDGMISAVELESGARVAGDLFLDCSGAPALLSHDHGFESWSAWLPCDRAIESRIFVEGVPPPYAHAGAHDAGWRRTIPLARGQGQALVYASAYLADADADAAGFGPAPAVRLEQGRRTHAWHGNVIAIGAAVALIEPLYGHNLQMVHTAIERLIALFPNSIHGPEAAEYNRLTASEADRVRDFAILHYKTNARSGQPFWDACRAMSVPETLQYNAFTRTQYEQVRDFVILHYKASDRPGDLWRHVRDMAVPDSLANRLALFANRGRVFRRDDELFADASWIAVMLGHGITPQGWDPLADALDAGQLPGMLDRIRSVFAQAAASLPRHADYLARNCSAASAAPRPTIRFRGTA